MNTANQHHLITREIGIDMGHRVTYHGSKCRNLHGHRYTVHAICKGPLFASGEQQGMVLDFGFLKEEMMNEIDSPCDHGTTLWVDDPLLQQFVDATQPDIKSIDIMADIRKRVAASGYCMINLKTGKTYVVPFVPTAENLARHWFERLAPRVSQRTEGQASLAEIKVWETPNCSASYSGV